MPKVVIYLLYAIPGVLGPYMLLLMLKKYPKGQNGVSKVEKTRFQTFWLKYSFRRAHTVTAKIVNFAEKNSLRLEDLTLDQFRKFDGKFSNKVFEDLNIKNAVLSKTSYGGTSQIEVIKMIKKAKKINKWKKLRFI